MKKLSVLDPATRDFIAKPALVTERGALFVGDSLEYLRKLPAESVDLVLTSPPFALVRKKTYGNTDADNYVGWFMQFATEIRRVLKATGSFVLDIGGSWLPGQPVRSTYHYKLLVALTDIGLFCLAQDFFWYSPSRLPAPAEWVTVRKIRAKDAVNTVWWLSKTPFPKAGNERVQVEYSEAMHALLKNGYKPKLRPSGYDISPHFQKNRGGAIPSNLLVFSHTSSNDYYQRRCREEKVVVHPARFPTDLPLFFISMLTDPGDLVVDIFAGSNVTGWVAEHMKRRWLAFELEKEFVRGAAFRFEPSASTPNTLQVGPKLTKIRPIRVRDNQMALKTGKTRTT